MTGRIEDQPLIGMLRGAYRSADPLPLLAQLRERYDDSLSIVYRQREAGAVVIDFTMLEDDNQRGGTCCGSCG